MIENGDQKGRASADTLDSPVSEMHRDKVSMLATSLTGALGYLSCNEAIIQEAMGRKTLDLVIAFEGANSRRELAVLLRPYVADLFAFLQTIERKDD